MKFFFLTLVGNAYTFNLKNHQVVKLNRQYIKDRPWIFSRAWQKGPPPGPDRNKTVLCTHRVFKLFVR